MEQITGSIYDGRQLVCSDVTVILREVQLPGGIQCYGWFPLPQGPVPVRVGGLYTLRAHDGRSAPITITHHRTHASGDCIVEFVLSGGLA
jgi:hypothetical protein